MAEQAGGKWLEGRGSELERPSPSGSSASYRAGPPPVARRGDAFAGRSRPGGAPVRARGWPAGPAPTSGFEALHGLYWLVVILTDRDPLALLVDDRHWADPQSLRFLAYLAQRIEGLPVAMALAGPSARFRGRRVHLAVVAACPASCGGGAVLPGP